MRHGWVTVAVWSLVAGRAAAQAPGEASPAEEPLPESLLDLSRLDLSGYVQAEARYEANGDEDDLFYFQVRRGRVKLTYDLSPATFVLQLDATQDGVELKDAYGALALPMPEGSELSLMAGLFKIPFGYDLQLSSSRRVFPERSQMVRSFFPGERDLGVRLDGSFFDELLEVQLALQNGVPVGDAFFGAYEGLDGNAMKDVTLRAAVNLIDHLTLGVSGLYGEGTGIVPDDPMTPAVDESATYDFPHWAAGAELRYRRELGSLGELDLYGEVSYARSLLRKRASQYPTDADDRVNALAWYVAVVQELGQYFALGARFDQLRVEDDDASNVVTLAGMALPADAVRVVLAYDVHLGDAAANEGWLRLQVKY